MVNGSITSEEQELQEWVQRTLAELREAKDLGKSTNRLTFKRTIPPEFINYYQAIQKGIAEILPNEYERPTFTIMIQGKNRPLKDVTGKAYDDKPDLGLLGGMGTLSDAQIITKIIKKMGRTEDIDNIYIKLYSAPPPRSEEKQQSLFRWFRHIFNYFIGVFAFGRSKCNHYALLSNTAHSNMASLQKFLTQPECLIHLVHHMAFSVAKENPGKILVLGTSSAAESNLYPSALSERGATAILPKPDRQELLQKYIDKVKSANITQLEREHFLEFILQEIRTAAIEHPGELSHVLLGCSEIPLFLEIEDSNGKTYQELLETKLADDPVFNKVKVKFVDSQEAMVDILCEHEKHVIHKKSHNIAPFLSNQVSENELSAKAEIFLCFKSNISDAIKQYLDVMSDIGLLVGVSLPRKIDFAEKVLADIEKTQNYEELKPILQALFMKLNKTHDWSLNVFILENLIGTCSKEQRAQFNNMIAKGNFSELVKEFLNLNASPILRVSADLSPGDIPIHYERTYLETKESLSQAPEAKLITKNHFFKAKLRETTLKSLPDDVGKNPKI